MLYAFGKTKEMRQIKKSLNKLTKDVKTALQNNRMSSYSYLLNMHPGDSNLWKEAKRL
jgi:hypothetical protein